MPETGRTGALDTVVDTVLDTGCDTGCDTVCGTADATRGLARALGTLLVGGDVVVLVGPLGAGKTTFVQGLALGLGVTAPVTSPTFVLARHQRPDPHGPRPDGPDLVHVDAYRLDGPLELDDLDLDSDLDRSVVVVEWGEGLAERLSPTRVQVQLERATGTTPRSGASASPDDAGRDDAGQDDEGPDDEGPDDEGQGDEPRTVRVRLVGADRARAERLVAALQAAPPC